LRQIREESMTNYIIGFVAIWVGFIFCVYQLIKFNERYKLRNMKRHFEAQQKARKRDIPMKSPSFASEINTIRKPSDSAEYLNKQCEKLENFIINPEITELDLIHLCYLNNARLGVYQGWHQLIIDMLNELESLGWNREIRFEMENGMLATDISENSTEHRDILDRYRLRSRKTCESCGKKGKLVIHHVDHESVSCMKCYVRESGTITANQIGFTYCVNEHERSFIWDDFERIEPRLHAGRLIGLLLYEKRISKDSSDEPRVYQVSDTCRGFGRFLQVIPRSIAKIENDKYAELETCKICGYKAVINDSCECCMNDSFLGLPSQTWESETEYILVKQMEWHLKEGELAQQAYPFYEKTIEPQLLYSSKELESWKNHWEEKEYLFY